MRTSELPFLWQLLRSGYYFLDDVNLERRDDRIFFIGFTSGFNSIKESCPSKTSRELDKLDCFTFFLVVSACNHKYKFQQSRIDSG